MGTRNLLTYLEPKKAGRGQYEPSSRSDPQSLKHCQNSFQRQYIGMIEGLDCRAARLYKLETTHRSFSCMPVSCFIFGYRLALPRRVCSAPVLLGSIPRDVGRMVPASVGAITAT